jgi:hypothetical protein
MLMSREDADFIYVTAPDSQVLRRTTDRPEIWTAKSLKGIKVSPQDKGTPVPGYKDNTERLEMRGLTNCLSGSASDVWIPTIFRVIRGRVGLPNGAPVTYPACSALSIGQGTLLNT